MYIVYKKSSKGDIPITPFINTPLVQTLQDQKSRQHPREFESLPTASSLWRSRWRTQHYHDGHLEFVGLFVTDEEFALRFCQVSKLEIKPKYSNSVSEVWCLMKKKRKIQVLVKIKFLIQCRIGFTCSQSLAVG